MGLFNFFIKREEEAPVSEPVVKTQRDCMFDELILQARSLQEEMNAFLAKNMLIMCAARMVS